MEDLEKAIWILRNAGVKGTSITLTRVAKTLGVTRPTVYRLKEKPYSLDSKQVAILANLYDQYTRSDLEKMLALEIDKKTELERMQVEVVNALKLAEEKSPDLTPYAQQILKTLEERLGEPNSALLQLIIHIS